MKRFITLLKHQIWLMTISSSTYFAAFLFLSFMAVVFLLSIHDVSLSLGKQSVVEIFLSVFWVPVLFMVPLLTMRTISDELRRGTLGSLMSTRVSAWQIVVSKFLACYLFYVLIWLCTLSFLAITLWYLPQVKAKDLFEPAQLITGYVFICLTGFLYVAIGVFASSLTRTTLVAGMLSFSMLFFLIVGAGIVNKIPLADDSTIGAVVSATEYLHTFRQLDDFNSSVMDTRAFFFYISSSIMLLAFTSLITESKNR